MRTDVCRLRARHSDRFELTVARRALLTALSSRRADAFELCAHCRRSCTSTEKLLQPAELLVHADLAVLMSAAVSGLRADPHLPRTVVEAHVWTALALALGQKAAIVERTAGATHQHVLL